MGPLLLEVMVEACSGKSNDNSNDNSRSSRFAEG
jgi:hypothetical protein